MKYWRSPQQHSPERVWLFPCRGIFWEHMCPEPWMSVGQYRRGRPLCLPWTGLCACPEQACVPALVNAPVPAQMMGNHRGLPLHCHYHIVQNPLQRHLDVENLNAINADDQWNAFFVRAIGRSPS